MLFEIKLIFDLLKNSILKRYPTDILFYSSFCFHNQVVTIFLEANYSAIQDGAKVDFFCNK